WLMPAFAAFLLAASPAIGWVLRGAFAGGAVALVDLALMSQSRGALVAVPLTLIALFAFVPGRVRHAAALVVGGGAGAGTGPTVVDIGRAVTGHHDPAGAIRAAVRATLIAALLAALAGGALAGLEHWRPPSPRRAARAYRLGGIAAAAAAVLVAL